MLTLVSVVRLRVRAALNASNVAAGSNQALCFLYQCDLPGAIAALEAFVLAEPQRNLRESIVFNLCTLYDLKGHRADDKKKQLLALVQKFAPDDFVFKL